jgi:pyruvate kinase
MKTNSRTQIVATIGPSSANAEIISQMITNEMDIARLNFGWANLEEHEKHLQMIREAEEKAGKKIKIIFDLPGPRIQKVQGHTYDKNEKSLLTEKDEKSIELGVKNNIEYFALSFVGDKEDVIICRNLIKKYNGNQGIIAKIERQKAIDNLDEIIDVSDAIMIARGDLGNEIAIETIPFIQDEIIRKSKKAGKPVITATQMMLSMTENIIPTRAEVTDVAYAVLQGSDAVMLSDETASGKHPVQAVGVMRKIIIEAEKHVKGSASLNLL